MESIYTTTAKEIRKFVNMPQGAQLSRKTISSWLKKHYQEDELFLFLEGKMNGSLRDSIINDVKK